MLSQQSRARGRHATGSRERSRRYEARRARRRPPVTRLRKTATVAVPAVLGLVAFGSTVGGSLGDQPAEAVPAPSRPVLAEPVVAAARADAAARGGRSQSRVAIPLPGASRTPTPTEAAAPAPTPTPTGFPPVPGCTATVLPDAVNGRISDDHLCPIGDGHRLRPDAAAAFLALDAAYQAAFGEPLMVTDSYRSLSAQRSLAYEKPSLAAEPGTSEHGWGLAVDLGGGVESYRSPRYKWLRANAPAFGWDHPTWARNGNGREEPWHWEYDVSFVPVG